MIGGGMTEKQAQTHVIVICTHGHALACRVEYIGEDSTIHFTSAAVIRVWGTTAGIGQLSTGPTEKTILDPIPARGRINGANVIAWFAVTGWGEV